MCNQVHMIRAVLILSCILIQHCAAQPMKPVSLISEECSPRDEEWFLFGTVCPSLLKTLSLQSAGLAADAEQGTANLRLSEWLWKDSKSQALAQTALHSRFIQGIKSGLLDPRHFGSFFVQDVVFCFYVVQHYKIATQKANGDSKMAAALQAQIKTSEKYNRELFEQWHIADPEAVSLTKAATEYINFGREVSEEMSPVYLLIAMLPCEKLWGWLANEIRSRIDATNIYSFWIEEHLISVSTLTNFIDDNAERYDVDLDTAVYVYQKALSLEVNFFQSATQGTS